jgi:hypothetical protein
MLLLINYNIMYFLNNCCTHIVKYFALTAVVGLPPLDVNYLFLFHTGFQVQSEGEKSGI